MAAKVLGLRALFLKWKTEIECIKADSEHEAEQPMRSHY